jgi:hypothetical protein
MFIGEPGCWNRRPLSGCEVLFVLPHGRPGGPPVNVVAGVVVDRHGGLPFADEAGHTVGRLTAAPAQASR